MVDYPSEGIALEVLNAIKFYMPDAETCATLMYEDDRIMFLFAQAIRIAEATYSGIKLGMKRRAIKSQFIQYFFNKLFGRVQVIINIKNAEILKYHKNKILCNCDKIGYGFCFCKKNGKYIR